MSRKCYCDCVIFSLFIYLQNIIYIHRISTRHNWTLTVAETSRLSAVQRNRRAFDGYLRATALYATIQEHCILARLRSLHIICMRIETCDISLNGGKEKVKGYSANSLALGIIKRHIENARRMHLMRKEANRFATRLFCHWKPYVAGIPIFYARFRPESREQLIHN
jgi:hypothetical protein